ncbi:MAG TPA: pteridine-dependent deoxygenase, partial [Oleiagrimonas sp.]|nr:pteridine-dependent deoxygenase [Oleiagrimonas sp.]
MPAAPLVRYTDDAASTLLRQPGTLALIGFGDKPVADCTDPRFTHVGLRAVDATPLPLECWHVDASVSHGHAGEVGWARGAGWLFARIEVAEADHGDDVQRCSEHAYRALCTFLAAQPEGAHVQRIWNYLDRINEGSDDDERYKRFCDGRLRGMGDFFDAGFPAATAIGHSAPTGTLIIYCLATDHPGQRIENPRQWNAWRYPRQYGRTPPSFARAMLFPAGDTLAISGTAAITGHESRHSDDLIAQLTEIRTNIDALLAQANMPAGLDADA